MQFRLNLEVEDEVFSSLLSQVGGWVGGWCGEVQTRANLSQVYLKLRLSLAMLFLFEISLLQQILVIVKSNPSLI